ncbi:MAG: response regulator [Deltaproteobacteria bacterium]|jgi:CheY-like chemotaxis protein|nr:response regulator [Deltaproteobacteria bacterium]MBW2536290.1 response regulator [Deltaproteobacteria bacterium]
MVEQGGARKQGAAADPAVAYLSTLVFEALDKVASPDARNVLIRDALERVSAERMPTDPQELLDFAVGPLRIVVADSLGEEAGEALVQDLQPILQHAAASVAPKPEPEPKPAAGQVSAVRRSPTGKRNTMPLAAQRERSSGEQSAARPVQQAPDSADALPRRQRATVPYQDMEWRDQNLRCALLVDDERAFLRGYSAALRERGYEVFTAADGPAAVLLCRRLEPELLVVDGAMPGLDARELVDEVAGAVGHAAPTVVVLGDGDLDGTPEGITLRCLPKPSEPGEALDALGIERRDEA